MEGGISLRSFKFNVDWVPIFLKKDSEVGKNTHHRETLCMKRFLKQTYAANPLGSSNPMLFFPFAHECQIHSRRFEGIDEPEYENYNYQTFSKGYPREPLKDSGHSIYPLLGSNYEDGKLFFSSTLKRTYRSYSFRGYCICPKKLERGDSKCPQCYGNESFSIGGEVIYPCNNALMNFIAIDLIKYEMGLNELIHFGSPSNARRYYIQLNEDIISSIPERFTNSNLRVFWENFVIIWKKFNDCQINYKPGSVI